MKDLFKKGIALGLGLAVMSKEQMEKFINDMVKRGEITTAESKDLIEDLIKKGEDEQQTINAKLQEQVQKVLKELDLPTKADLQNIERRIANLENLQGNITNHTPDSD